MNEFVDYEAREQAAIANQKIDSHEKNCGERWREARDQMRAVRNFQWWIVSLLITGQGAALYFLLDLLSER